MRKTISLFLALTLLFTLAIPANAADDATGTSLRLEETNGTVTVKDASGLDKSVRKGMRIYSGYTIATGASSSAYISLDDTKAVKLDSSGTVEIKKTGKKLEVSLTSGQLYFNVTEPLKTDESLNIRTSTMVTGIRGSFGWVNATRMALLHGHVTLTCINPETGESRVTEVYSGEQVRYEEAVSPEIAADPVLLEIDFVKEEVKVEDVPAIVVEQVANDVTLQTQLEEVETIEVTELIDSLETKQEAEAVAETEKAKEADAILIEQEKVIAESISADAELGDTAQVYADLTTVAAPTVGGGGGGSSDSGPSVYTVTVHQFYSDVDVYSPSHTVDSYDDSSYPAAKRYRVTAGSILALAIDVPVASDGAKYELGERGTMPSAMRYSDGTPMGEFVLDAAGDTYTLSLPISENAEIDVNTGRPIMRLKSNDVVNAATIHTYLSKYSNVLLDMSAGAGGDLTLSDTLTVAANQNLELTGGTLTLSGTSFSGRISGDLAVLDDARLSASAASMFAVLQGGYIVNLGETAFHGTVRIDSGARMQNVGTMTSTGVMLVYGQISNGGVLTIGNGISAATLTVEGVGRLYNYGTIQNKANATITNNGTIENETGTINNEIGATMLNNATIDN